MLDDMSVLRPAVEAYRAAATAAGVPWPDAGERNDRPSRDVLCRVFDVDRIPDQPVWLVSEALPYERVLPAGAHVLSWADPDGLLDYLSFAVGVPFDWRHQIPLFSADHLVFTFVLSGDREGEIWRYQVGADDWNPVRAAPSLVALFTEWTRGFAANVYDRSPYDSWLHIGYAGGDPFDLLVKRGLDPFAFPVDISAYSQEGPLRARQRDCGVDVDRADLFEAHEELLDAVDAARAALRP